MSREWYLKGTFEDPSGEGEPSFHTKIKDGKEKVEWKLVNVSPLLPSVKGTPADFTYVDLWLLHQDLAKDRGLPSNL